VPRGAEFVRSRDGIGDGICLKKFKNHKRDSAHGAEGDMGISSTGKKGAAVDRRSFLADKLRNLKIPRARSVALQADANPDDRTARLKKGELIDVSYLAREVGFTVHVACSREVWAGLIEIGYDLPALKRNPRMKERRLLNVLLEALQAARRKLGSREVQFSVYRITSKAERETCGKIAIKSDLAVRCDPGDFGEPVVTISLAEVSTSSSEGISKGGESVQQRRRAARRGSQRGREIEDASAASTGELN